MLVCSGSAEQVSCLMECQASARPLPPAAGSLPCRWCGYQWCRGSSEMPSRCPSFKSTGCRSYKFRLTWRTVYSGWRSRAHLWHWVDMGVLQIQFLKLWRIWGRQQWKLCSLKRKSVPGFAQESGSLSTQSYSHTWRRLWLKKICSWWDWWGWLLLLGVICQTSQLHFPEN